MRGCLVKIKPGKRLLGQTFDGKPIFAPKHSHSLLLAAAGSGKTTCGAMPWLFSLISETDHAIVVNDCKEGEISAQVASLAHKYGRKVAIIDDFNVLGKHPLKTSLNPMGGVASALNNDNGDFIFSVDSMCRALIQEPKDGDKRNEFFRSEPRTIIEYAVTSLLNRSPDLAIPGGVWSFITQRDTLIKAAELDFDEGDENLRSLASHVLGMRDSKEHFAQHIAETRKALRIYSSSSAALHKSGVDSKFTHEQLLREKYIVFIVGPIRHMERLGAHYALHLQSFVEAQLCGERLPCSFVLDEFTNAPLKSLISQLTTMRGFGGSAHMIAQSRSEIERKYGEKESQTITENAVVQQWFGLSSEKESELLSKLMGERITVSSSLNTKSEQLGFSNGLTTGKERLYTPERLLSLPNDEQIIFIKDIGFIHCKKVAQNQLAPYCYDVEDNPLEGDRLPPDPLFTLAKPEVTQ